MEIRPANERNSGAVLTLKFDVVDAAIKAKINDSINARVKEEVKAGGDNDLVRHDCQLDRSA